MICKAVFEKAASSLSRLPSPNKQYWHSDASRSPRPPTRHQSNSAFGSTPVALPVEPAGVVQPTKQCVGVEEGTCFTDRNQSIPIHFSIEGDVTGLRVGQFVTVLANTDERSRGRRLIHSKQGAPRLAAKSP